MKEINMGGFENQRIGVTFAGNRYEIDLDAPAEIYRQFFALPRPPETEHDWNLTKKWLAEFIGHYNDINKKKFKESLTKVAVINFVSAYNDFLKGASSGSKKVKKTPKKKPDG